MGMLRRSHAGKHRIETPYGKGADAWPKHRSVQGCQGYGFALSSGFTSGWAGVMSGTAASGEPSTLYLWIVSWERASFDRALHRLLQQFLAQCVVHLGHRRGGATIRRSSTLTTCQPNSFWIGVWEICPGCRLKATSANSGHTWSRRKKPRSPPFCRRDPC